MRTFRLAISGDILNAQGNDAYGGLPLDDLDRTHAIDWHFTRDHGPQPGDRDYWSRFYSLEVEPRHLQDLDGYVLLRPWLKRPAMSSALP